MAPRSPPLAELRRLPVLTPLPTWQLFELKRLCVEGLKVPMFRNPVLLRRALTHASSPEYSAKYGSNAALEAFGDPVLGAFVTAQLAKRRPKRLTLLSDFFVSNEQLSKVATRIGLQHCVRFQRDERGLPRDMALLAGTYEAVVAAIMVDHGSEVTNEFVERTLVSELASSYVDGVSDDEMPYDPHNALGAELNFWRRQMLELTGERMRPPDAEVVVEATRARSRMEQYFRVRLEIEGVVLGRGDGFNRKRAVANCMLAATRTFRSPVRSVQRRGWNDGESQHFDARSAVECLHRLGLVQELREDNGSLTVDGARFPDAEEALKWLRSRSAGTDLKLDSHYPFGLDLDLYTMRQSVPARDVEQIERLSKIANERSDVSMVARWLHLGERVLQMFAAEEALWAVAWRDKHVRKAQLAALRRAQDRSWLRAQRAERLGFVPTRDTLEHDQRIVDHANVLERRMGSGLRLAAAVMFQQSGYETAREALHKVTYFD